MLLFNKGDYEAADISSQNPKVYKERFMQFAKKVVFRNFR